MTDQMEIYKKSADFLISETDRVLDLVFKTKSEKKRLQYIQQLENLKNRMTLELKMLDNFEENS